MFVFIEFKHGVKYQVSKSIGGVDVRNSLGAYFGVAIVTIVAIVLAVGIYIGELHGLVSDTMNTAMDELALHDAQLVSSSVKVTCTQLEESARRLNIGAQASIDDLFDALKYESDMSGTFEDIYLIDSEGSLYSARGVDPGPYIEQAEKMLSMGDGQFVARDCGEFGDMSGVDGVLVYGVRLPDFEIAGRNFVIALGTLPYFTLSNMVQPDAFGAQGNVNIVDRDGFLIVNGMNASGSFDQENLFDMLQTAQFIPGQSLDGVKQGIENGRTFSVECKFKQGYTIVMCFAPIEGTPWSTMVSAPKDMFDSRASSFITMTMLMLLVVAIILIIMALLIYRYLRRSIVSDACAQERSEFLASMSHEIRTPLNGIIGLNYLMGHHLDDREKMAEYVRKMGDTSQFLLALVSDILDVSKLQADKTDVVKEPIDIAYLFNTMVNMQRSIIESRGIEFRCLCSLSKPYVYGDEMRIKQVLMNLLSNATKFTDPGGCITFSVSQKQASEPGFTHVVFVVEDTGCGMSEEFQEHIFDAFSQEGGKHLAEQKGTGLGMSISKLLMDLMGGTLGVTSKLGEGSCFTASFTFALASATMVAKRYSTIEATRDTYHNVATEYVSLAERKTILVAEDDDLNAEVLVSILKEHSFECITVANGYDAVEAFKQSDINSIGAILMDSHMPRMDGFEATRSIRALERPDAQTVRIYACSASTFREDKERAMKSGMDGYITKPIDVKMLFEKLKDL